MSVTYDKDGGYIEIVENGVTYRRGIRIEDGVVSLVDPDGTSKKVDLIYVDASDQLVLVLEDESTVTITAGAGDMTKAVYDPTSVEGDAFDVDNHVDGTTNKVYTAIEKTKLTGIATGADVTADNAPKAHAASHVAADAIQSATAAQAGLATAAQITKLDGIEASAVALATVKADADISDAITKKHSQNTDTDLDATFEATFMKKAAMNLLDEDAGLQLDSALSADGKYCGIVEAGTLGATVAFGEVVYLKAADSEWYLAKADATATSGAVKIGICLLAGADGEATTILLWGKVRADAKFPTFTISAPVFISAATAGLLTSTAPTGTTNFVVRIVGYGNTGDELFFAPDATYIELA